MKCIAKVGNDGKLSVDKVADEIANKMNIVGNLSKANVGTTTLKPGNYYVSKEVYREVNGLSKPKEENVVKVEKKVIEKKEPKEHRKAKDIRAANQKHKRG